ncbi:MAG: hypothetical protein ACRCTZ_22585 [Sarcina sp.]
MFNSPFDLIIDKELINPYDIYKTVIETWIDGLCDEDVVRGNRILIICEDKHKTLDFLTCLGTIISCDVDRGFKINRRYEGSCETSIEFTYDSDELDRTRFLKILISPLSVLTNEYLRGYRFNSIIIDLNETRSNNNILNYEILYNVFLPLMTVPDEKSINKFILMYRGD